MTILDSSGAPVMNMLVRTRGPAGYWMAQGSTDALGRLTLVGLYAGDSLLVQGPGSASVGFVRRIPMTPGPLSITI